MNADSRLERANDNAAAFWLSQARVHGWRFRTARGLTAVRCARTPDDAHRFVVTRRYAEPGLLERELAGLLSEWSTIGFVLEDPYGGLDLTRLGAARMPLMPVMVRDPGPVEGMTATLPAASEAVGGGLLTVDEARGGDSFASVERAIVEGFPLPARQPWVRGEALPEQLLREPGWRAWLGRVDGAVAGACLTYDDGRATGVYWVVTLPEHRGRGVARAVLQTALAHAHQDRPATLVATTLGEPLYRTLGFAEQARTCWWSRT
ncbi:GNAT family N-acetyltransferase [Streptomyces sp. 1331.2]|uniref:GNAT family N-acetyltransferase n=1 Tax=Streptomyces sp. 1331.2 TaxID=1938835 RepID=UPI000BD20084|nr:GNAT family N-acetyltransferase [Streptomyces sp. 1331.2]SOB84036.1 Ribosomal protein S18 acetylase RimI [Streptomyces sp. 1331.2]